MKDWELYEDKIFSKFQSEFPDHEIIKDMKVTGQFSNVKRQIDIGIKKDVAGYGAFGVVECKYFSRNIDVKIVEGFIGFLDDVQANFGIIITNMDYSGAAINRARVKGIKLDIIDMDELDDYSFEWEPCSICDPGDERPPTQIHYTYGYQIVIDGIISLFDFGRCDWCNGINIRCQSCGCLTGIPEHMYGETVECEGGCGIEFLINQKHIEKGLYEEELFIVGGEEVNKAHHKQVGYGVEDF